MEMATQAGSAIIAFKLKPNTQMKATISGAMEYFQEGSRNRAHNPPNIAGITLSNAGFSTGFDKMGVRGTIRMAPTARIITVTIEETPMESTEIAWASLVPVGISLAFSADNAHGHFKLEVLPVTKHMYRAPGPRVGEKVKISVTLRMRITSAKVRIAGIILAKSGKIPKYRETMRGNPQNRAKVSRLDQVPKRNTNFSKTVNSRVSFSLRAI